ncbi:MAG: DUF3098 domain-containing protein [Catalinimonas sp.]
MAKILTKETEHPAPRPTAKPPLVFGRRNWVLTLVGLGLLALGFLIMSLESGEYGFGFMGLTLGPLVLMAGFVVELFAIFAPTKHQDRPAE